MLRKLFMTGVCLFVACGLFVLSIHGYQYYQFVEYKKELTLELKALEKTPQSKRSAKTYFKIADSSLLLNHNAEKIVSAYKQASDLGHSQATYKLAMISSARIKTNIELPKAQVLFEKAALEGSLSAKFTLKAHKILETVDITAGYEAIISKLLESADKGNIEASYLLCAHGKEEVSRIFAVGNLKYCEIAVKENHPAALYLMGRLFEQNPNEFHPETWALNGLEKDNLKAIDYYQRAAALSYQPALERLKILENGNELPVTKSNDCYAYLPDSLEDYFLTQ